jgi:hypothetical protein
MLGDGIGRQQPQHAFRGLLPFGGSSFATGRLCLALGGVVGACGIKRAGKDNCQYEAAEEGKGHRRAQLL